MCTQNFFIYYLTESEVLWQCCEMNKLTLQGATNEKHLNSSNLINKPAWSHELCFLQIKSGLNPNTIYQLRICNTRLQVVHISLVSSLRERDQRLDQKLCGVFCRVNVSQWALMWWNAGMYKSTLKQCWIWLKTEHFKDISKGSIWLFGLFPLKPSCSAKKVNNKIISPNS